MPLHFSPLLRNVHHSFSSSARMARVVQRTVLAPLNLTAAAATRSFRWPSYLGFVSHGDGSDDSSASESSLFGRRFHALCGNEQVVVRPLQRICAAQRDYRKVRRRPGKSKEKELQLNVSICVEEQLPDDPEILVAISLSFLVCSTYKSLDTPARVCLNVCCYNMLPSKS